MAIPSAKTTDPAVSAASNTDFTSINQSSKKTPNASKESNVTSSATTSFQLPSAVTPLHADFNPSANFADYSSNSGYSQIMDDEGRVTFFCSSCCFQAKFRMSINRHLSTVHGNEAKDSYAVSKKQTPTESSDVSTLGMNLNTPVPTSVLSLSASLSDSGPSKHIAQPSTAGNLTLQRENQVVKTLQSLVPTPLPRVQSNPLLQQQMTATGVPVNVTANPLVTSVISNTSSSSYTPRLSSRQDEVRNIISSTHVSLTLILKIFLQLNSFYCL